ncbi:MAG: cyclic nucleotide-binding domain-containing protein, partial [Chloroflexi bacterium]|nr:cyclic nucleotide-binding domain-containing protein [Chloroflexota bacterium]
SRGDGQPLATLQEGEFFGEMALLAGTDRSTAVRAVQDTTLWMLPRADFEGLLVRQPSISLALNRALSQRLLDADRRFHDAHLRRIPLFRPLTDAQLDEVAGGLKQVSYPAGTVICREGDPGDRMWFIEMGRVDVHLQLQGARVDLATLASGDFFGEMALLTGGARSATVQAVTPVELWSLDKARFDKMLAQHPTIAVALSQTLSKRLHGTTERLAEYAVSRGQGRRAAASLPERREVVATAPAVRPAAVPQGPSVFQRAVQRLQEMAQETASWFSERSASSKVRLAAVLLLLAWLLGISAPATLLSALTPVMVSSTDALVTMRQAETVAVQAPASLPVQGAVALAVAPPAPAAEEPQALVEEPTVALVAAPAQPTAPVVFGGGEPPTAEPTAAADARQAAPSPEAAPTATPEPAPYCVIDSETLNVRSGPGTVYDRVGQARVGQSYEILACSDDGWYLIDYEGKEAWVSGDFVQLRGDEEAIALAENIPPRPTPAPAALPANPAPAPQMMAAAAVAPAPSKAPVSWDGRLDACGVRMEQAPVAPGQQYWRLVEARWANEQESQGKHHIYVNVLDEGGQRLIGQPVIVNWVDGQVTVMTEDKPKTEMSCNFGM